MSSAAPIKYTSERPDAVPWYGSPIAIVGMIALFRLAFHLYAARFYGYFVDELYFIACSDHLSWGYVDQPPFIALVVKLARILFGDSLQSIRFFAGLAGAATVFLAGWIARELGGRRYAQILAALAALVAPVSLSMSHYISMNAFEPLFWMGSAFVLIRILKTGNQKLWLWFGLIAGIGLENKYGIAFFGAGVVVGLILTNRRWMLLQGWIWLGGLIAFAIFLPNLIWNVRHHFPFFELLANVRHNGRNIPLTHWQFLWQVCLTELPHSVPLWIGGLFFFFFDRNGKQYRVLGWTFLSLLGMIMLSANGRPYYTAPAFPMLFAAGAVLWENCLSCKSVAWLKPIYAIALVIGGIIGAPLAVPILLPETYIAYTKALGMGQPRIETHKLGPLPQFYADMFGWEEMVGVVAKAYNALPPDERSRTAIFGGNFGQAGAIDLFGKKYGLPRAIATHQTYYFWGPRAYSGDSMIVMGARLEELTPYFSSIRPVGQVYHPYAMPYEQFTVYYCRGIKMPLKDLWPKIKNWN